MSSVLARFAPGTSGWQRILSFAAAVAISALMAVEVTGCGGGGGSSGTLVAAAGAPTNFNVMNTAGVSLSETLTWSPPTTGGAPASYEVYRSTTAGTAFLPENHLISLPATTYTFIDNAGLASATTYWAVSAKNTGGETATAERSDMPSTTTGGGGGEDTGFGNNFSAALVFADDVGITGLPIPSTSVWTTNAASAVAEITTGLRPLSTEVIPVTTLPYLDPTATYVLNNVTYYKQASSNAWQGQWVLGAGAMQPAVTATWGDNLVSQSLSSTSVIRVEMVLSEPIASMVPATTTMTTYPMVSLYGTKTTEVTGTTGVPDTTTATSAFVFAANAHLTIWKDGQAPLINQTLWAGDGPGFFAAEVNVSGNFTYGFVWNLKNVSGLAYPKTGLWHLKFSLDSASPTGSVNHTTIIAAPNSASFTATEATIDINVN